MRARRHRGSAGGRVDRGADQRSARSPAASEAIVMISVIQQKPRQAVVEVLDLMRKRGLSLDDLIQVGGEDLKSPNPKRVKKAHYVEKAWALMARLSVKFADLEQAPKPARRTVFR